MVVPQATSPTASNDIGKLIRSINSNGQSLPGRRGALDPAVDPSPSDPAREYGDRPQATPSHRESITAQTMPNQRDTTPVQGTSGQTESTTAQAMLSQRTLPTQINRQPAPPPPERINAQAREPLQTQT